MRGFESELKNYGWTIWDCPNSSDLSIALEKIANFLGKPILGRYGQILERLQPTSKDQAHPQSLSQQYGLGAFPLHNDTAHLPIPCRYIVMGCEEPGHRGSLNA